MSASDELPRGTRPKPIARSGSYRLSGKVREPGEIRVRGNRIWQYTRCRDTRCLSIAILFDNFRTVADLRHASPDFAHGVENLRFLAGRHARGSGNRA